MANSTIPHKAWTLLKEFTFASVTQESFTLDAPSGSYSEVYIVGGNVSAVIPIVPEVTSYQTSGYLNYAGYGQRIGTSINIATPNKILWTVRLEEKLQNTGYPTMRLYIR